MPTVAKFWNLHFSFSFNIYLLVLVCIAARHLTFPAGMNKVSIKNHNTNIQGENKPRTQQSKRNYAGRMVFDW